MSELPNDEIDLIELLQVIWGGKWLIVAVTGVISLISLTVLLMLPSTQSVELRIRPLSPQEMSAYAPLNNVPGISPPIYAGQKLVGHQGVIKSEEMMQAVQNHMRSGKPIRTALRELDPAVKNFQGSPEEKQQIVFAAAEDFELVKEKGLAEYRFKTETTTPELAKAIIERVVELTRQNIRNQNLAAIANLKKSIETILAYEIEVLETEILIDKQRYFDDMQSRIAQLKEQARIARVLNLASPPQNMTVNTTVSTSSDSKQFDDAGNLFTRGFKALEEEVKLLEQRGPDSWADFTPEYAEKNAKLRQLKSDKRAERVETGLALSPISDAALFTPAFFDTDGITVKSQSNKLLILVLITMLTAIAVSIFVLMRHFVEQRQKNAT